MVRNSEEPLLLTPGPLTTADSVKRRMLRDWGSRDEAFIALTARVRKRLNELAGGAGSHACVLLQGSGTFAVEAMIGALVPAAGRLLVLVNGAYGRRMARICEIIGRPCETLETAEDALPEARQVEARLQAAPGITHVALVHCETTSGLLNPLAEIAEVVARQGRSLLVDAMSSFGALPLDVRALPATAVAASSNKCLEGVPGIAFVIAREEALIAAAGNAHSLSLDLFEQWRGFEGNGQWRFTPPTQVLAALEAALGEHEAEGGVRGRGGRYARNHEILVHGMRALGFETLLPDPLQAPIIVSFRMPADPNFTFEGFYRRLRERGFVIYPGKLTAAETFRIGCIGHIGAAEMEAALAAIAEVLGEMAVTDCGPAPAAAARA
jgi:2-aminoethylphosphonate-pyruvate transaminase